MKRKNILCICAKGLNRSRYLASYLKNRGYRTRFGGIEGFSESEQAPNPITQEDVAGADVLVITRKRLKPVITKKFRTKGKKIVLIDVTDSKRLLPAKFSYLKDADRAEFERKWMKPQLRKAIKPFLPL